MWNRKNQEQLNYILRDFDDIPYLTLESTMMITEEQRFYAMHDDDGKRFGVLTGQFMDDLLAVAEHIEHNTDFTVDRWFYSKVSQSERCEFEGDEYAVCVLIER